MHSYNHPALAQQYAAERMRDARSRAVHRRRLERPPNVPVRGRVAYAAGRFARRMDREMARRAVV